MKRLIAVALATLALAACSSGPSTDDVKAAVRKQMTAIGGSQAADLYAREIDAIKVLGCKSVDHGYECDVQGVGGVQRQRFVKTDDGWALAQ
ncbi:lipoprotein [Dyella telluris]|uniref:Type IV secretion system putative lipoprotein virB7 n=1 Tax=Dyella telluris TaxID=2763498 RepID=A0A7G8Q3A0_9GAMM|nr:lipoprotein [Dyella telluris]QNK01258.1 hypothetical protein H8F01_19765 [Dyella telluris]